ncbi:MAG TPA: hypothetical protein VIK72_18735 [Clostridiaceae bacterium]
MAITKYVSVKIYHETVGLSDVNKNKKLELTFQNATIFGLSAFMLSFFFFPIIMIGGRNIITIFLLAPFFISAISLNYIKVRLVETYKIINSKLVLAFDNIFLIVDIIVLFYFSDSNLLVLNEVSKHCNISFLSFIFCILMLIPMFFTNRKIGNEWTRIKKTNWDN